MITKWKNQKIKIYGNKKNFIVEDQDYISTDKYIIKQLDLAREEEIEQIIFADLIDKIKNGNKIDIYKHKLYVDLETYADKEKINKFDIKNNLNIRDFKNNRFYNKPALNPFINKILTITIYRPDNNTLFIFDLRNFISENPTRLFLFLTKYCLVFHRSEFDIGVLLYHGKFVITNTICTLLLSQKLTLGFANNSNFMKHDLESALLYWCNKKINKNNIGSSFINFDEDSNISKTQYNYIIEDVLYLPMLLNSQLDCAIKDGLIKKEDRLDFNSKLNSISIENHFCWIKTLASVRGIKLDIDLLDKFKKQCKLDLINKNKELDDIYIKTIKKCNIKNNNINLDLFGNISINWSSSKQVIEAFQPLNLVYNIYDKQNKVNKFSVDKQELLKNMGNKDTKDLVLNYIEYKNIINEYNKYHTITNTLNLIDGKFHTEYQSLKRTGRISAKEPNLQSQKRGKNRKLFIAEKGNSFCVLDYSAQEPRVTASITKDSKLINFFNNNKNADIHSFIATKLSKHLIGKHTVINKKNNPYIKRYSMSVRDLSKKLSLAIDYGKSAFSFKFDIRDTEENAQKIIDLMSNEFPDKTKGLNDKSEYAIKNNKVIINDKTPCYRYLDPKTSDESKSRVGRNTPIQGTAALMTKLSSILFYKYLKNNNMFDPKNIDFNKDSNIVIFVHDEIVTEQMMENEKIVYKLLKKAMLDSAKIFCSNVAFEVEGGYGNKWEH